ncbi:MAG: hypothetical protein A2487_07730 [Candidatus Raymondbacteria bacterium RifOxyC12_full_50_8]|uniref:Nudix hydrolase domain-containing protein n=1 Tax=Candidatus Raymondbacteria bacterium RIFOXYD12_FULL_49_13 TaxID=1817890 RepID=A0A1F7F6H7_UNCRA|nr:MAG: hypothetical protein A2248_13230 [Candidatus Raymondbacteria bacterium RIFOXYA2_FULL_49_16]OGJ96060.1 MAG: hypothetical protein A2350_04670 [Candidatus Raymondbacteria bacterium RifOxyB12_full_50_8]OGJ99313.1 MAG: hypothetical protein A2487_07730 [Candidatus Raymondbacteria bacterium RifOxyC12_full_50_8]OGK02249.1 MAG: hypothetical protein A2519_16345 [Candidatus Raymondbacteria bacterium RIFOXYD12_FULL_49_13]OGP45138.1 MAG: hypothetical protein A2324_12125 [Candidatus Raymondbacteria b
MKRHDPLFEPVTKRERPFTGSYLSLERLTITLPDGKRALREIVRVRDAVAVLPIDNHGIVHLVRQHRPAIGRTILEIPAGVIDKKETPAACARRECAEETGFRPRRLRKLLTYAHAEGYSTGFITLFAGTDLVNTGSLKLDKTEFVEQVSMPFKKLLWLVQRKEIIDSKTILCALLVADSGAKDHII